MEKLKNVIDNENFTNDINAVRQLVIGAEDLARFDLIDNFHFELDGKAQFIQNSIRITIRKENLEKLIQESGSRAKISKNLKKLKGLTSSSIILALIDGKFVVIE